MITITDNIKYLQEGTKDSLIDINNLLNLPFKQIVEKLKKKINSIDCKGESAKVSINGEVLETGNSELNVSLDECSSDELKNKIQILLKE